MCENAVSLDNKNYLICVRSQNSRSMQNKVYDKAVLIIKDILEKHHSSELLNMDLLTKEAIKTADKFNQLEKLTEPNTYWIEINNIKRG